jgi:phenylpropionate dioxygenase-like ring-hydroxylating dioxygenase large terminal subunit
MVHHPTRGSGPRRHGDGVPQLSGIPPATLDADVYRDPERYERERERVLRRSWLIAGRSDEIPSGGDHLLYEGHGETVVVVRQADGTARAFHNVCQHRGARLVRGCGRHASKFVCPWHGWTYDTDGRLAGVPDRRDFASVQLAGLRAPRVAVEEWAGWIWIFLAADEAPPLAAWLGEMQTELAAYRMEEMFVFEKAVYDVPCNYKAIVDGFNEAYHIAELHKVPPEVVRASRETSYAALGRHTLMIVPLDPPSLAELQRSGDHQATVTCHYALFPNAVFNNLPDHLQLFQPIPLGPHASRFVCWELQYKDGGAAYRKQVETGWEFLKKVVEQDVFVFNELAATRQSMGYTANRFSERECKPTAYHEEMARLIGSGAPQRIAKETPQ